MLTQWTLILGFFMPLLVSVVVQSHWKPGVKAAFGFATCLGAALIETALQGQLNTNNWLGTGLAVAALSITFFKGFWKPLGIAGLVEQVTNFSPGLNASSTPFNSAASDSATSDSGMSGGSVTSGGSATGDSSKTNDSSDSDNSSDEVTQ